MFDARTSLAACFVGFASLIVGCTPNLDDVASHPDLDHRALREGGVAVLPASSFVADLSAADGQHLLVSNVWSERGELPISTIDAGEDADEVVRAIVDGHGHAEDAVGRLAAESGARFIAVVHFDHYATTSSDFSDTYIAEDGTVRHHWLRAHADLDGEVVLFEGTSGEIWWRGSHVEHGTNEVQHTDSAWPWHHHHYPDPPSAYELADDMMEAVVSNWPERS